MTFSLRRKHPTTPRRARRTATAATISLLALLVVGPASAQTLVPGPVDWRPVSPNQGPPEMPIVRESVMPVQFKPAQPPGVQPGVPTLPEPKHVGSRTGRTGVPLQNRILNAETEAEFSIKTIPPGIDQLTQRMSEEELHNEIRMESDRVPGQGRVFFPQEEPVSTAPYAGRQSKPSVRFVEPTYVNHKPLYFEQKNWERYGWQLGPLSPALELGEYFYDLVLLPYHIGADTCHCMDSSRGKCLPGDPVPLLLYPERLSVTGVVFEAGTILGGLFIFP